MGRRGRAHRHRPYQSPLYIRVQSSQTKPTAHVQSPPTKCVGAVPACPPERPRSGVSIPKIHAWCAGNERRMHPCGATRAGTQAPPLPISTKPRGVFIPHRIAHSIAPNHAVCHYPIGVILSIAQGWQVQRSLPWVTMQARRLPPWGLYFFHHIAFLCPPTQHSGAEMHRALPPPFFKTSYVCKSASR